jgi:2',3'-cyclic-nucleotide 2'-phosphodiesterase (5'-nucleotidase family)
MRSSFLLFIAFALALGAVPSLTILHTNDLHQALDNLPRIAGYVAAEKSKNPDAVFIDAGDWFDRGSSLPLVTRGEAIYGTMATMGYDMWIPGNHDWSYSGARLRQLMAKYPMPVLGSNLGCTDHPLPANVVPVLVRELAGLRVGFLGITLDTYGKSPKGRPYIHVVDARESTARAVRQLRAQKVDLIVAVTHLGFERMKHEKDRKCPTDLELAREFPDIDVIVGGHSHTALNEARIREVHAETGCIIVQAGASGRYVGRLDLQFDPTTHQIAAFDVGLVPVDATMPELPQTAAFLAAQYAEHMPNAERVVGTLDAGLERYNAGYWYADLLRQQTGADLVLLPVNAFYKEPSAFRKGPMTVERLRGYFFDKYLVELRVAGRDLIAYLQQPSRIHRLNPLHDRGRPYSEDALYTAGFSARFDAGTKQIAIGLDPDTEYTLVTPWFHSWRHLLDGSDHGLPPLAVAAKADPLPGLKHDSSRVLPATSMELVLREATTNGLTFARRYPTPAPDWEPWRAYYEAERARR